ncbi:MAG: hypothetical protein ACJA16_001031 [Akkermansiaceae bacterium]
MCVIYVTGATRSISRTNSKGRCNHVESPPPSCSVSQSVLPDDFQKSLRLRSKLAPQLLPVFVNQSLSGQRTSPKPCPAIDRCGTLSAVGISLADIAPPLLPWCSESGRWASRSTLSGSRSLRFASGGRRALFLAFVPQSRPVAPSSIRSAEGEAAAPKFLLRSGILRAHFKSQTICPAIALGLTF